MLLRMLTNLGSTSKQLHINAAAAKIKTRTVNINFSPDIILGKLFFLLLLSIFTYISMPKAPNIIIPYTNNTPSIYQSFLIHFLQDGVVVQNQRTPAINAMIP